MGKKKENKDKKAAGLDVNLGGCIDLDKKDRDSKHDHDHKLKGGDGGINIGFGLGGDKDKHKSDKDKKDHEFGVKMGGDIDADIKGKKVKGDHDKKKDKD